MPDRPRQTLTFDAAESQHCDPQHGGQALAPHLSWRERSLEEGAAIGAGASVQGSRSTLGERRWSEAIDLPAGVRRARASDGDVGQ